MPTSAGKTLLAKLSIVQTLALNPESTVAYVVPTRALVNQVVDDFRADSAKPRLTVEQAIRAVQIDPTEDQLLRDAPMTAQEWTDHGACRAVSGEQMRLLWRELN